MRIEELLGRTFRCPSCGRDHAVGVREIHAGPGVIRALPEALRAAGPAARPLLVSDGPAWAAAGPAVRAALPDAPLLLLEPRGEPCLSAREELAAPVAAAARNAGVIVSVGSGTVTDLVKKAAADARVPAVALATAPSMNAYTSGVAALLSRGLKVTASVPPPAAVVADTDILAAAPVEMIRAGFADSLAKPFADADWRLSSAAAGGGYCGFPSRLLDEAGPPVDGAAAARRDPAAVERLMEILNLGGISMLIAGASSPASGGEHLFSHLLDMAAHEAGEPPFALHGAQVGIGCLFSALLYELAAGISVVPPAPPPGRCPRRIAAMARRRPGAAAVLGSVLPAKEASDRLLEARLPAVLAEVRAAAAAVPRPAALRARLAASGSPLSPAAIGVPEAEARDALLCARCVRDRITILDVADRLGILEGAVEAFLSPGAPA